MLPSSSVVAWFILLVATRGLFSASAATQDHEDQNRELQSFQFGGTTKFFENNPSLAISPAPTDTYANDDYYDEPTISPWPTRSPYPTTSAEPTETDLGGGIDEGGDTPGSPVSPPLNATTSTTPPSEGGITTEYNETTLEPTRWGNETTVEPSPPPVVVVQTPVPTVSPSLQVVATPAPTPSDSVDNIRFYDDDEVPTISPAPTFGDGPESNNNSGQSWSTWTHTNEPTAIYVAPNDDVLERQDDDKIKKEWEEKSNLEKAEAEWNEISHDKNVKIVSIVFGVTGFLLLLFVAHQLIENPDGFFGKLCRCLLSCVRIICWPCRFLCCRSTRARDRRTHQLVNSEPSSYGYSHDLELT